MAVEAGYVFVSGTVLHIVRCLVASLVSTHEMPASPTPSCENQNVSRHCQLTLAGDGVCRIAPMTTGGGKQKLGEEGDLLQRARPIQPLEVVIRNF